MTVAHTSLPAAISSFLGSAGNPDAALHSFALGAVVIDEGTAYRGPAAIRELLGSRDAADSWTVDYAIDTEVVLTTSDNRSLQFLLDCGRIAYLRIQQVEASMAVAAGGELSAA